MTSHYSGGVKLQIRKKKVQKNKPWKTNYFMKKPAIRQPVS